MPSLALPQIEIVLRRPAKSQKPASRPAAQTDPKPKTSGISAAAKNLSGAALNSTGRAIKTSVYVWPAKIVLAALDFLAIPFGHMAGKDINFPLLWKVGCGMIFAAFWLYILIHSTAASFLKEVGISESAALSLALVAKAVAPGLLAFAGACMIIGGTRLQQGKSYMQKFGMELTPLPAFESGVFFKIGDLKLSLRDMHTGVGAFGGVGSGKAQGISALVSTTYGRRKLGSLKVGDKVSTPTNKEETIQNIIFLGQQKLWRLRTKTGEETLCTKNHLWLVKEIGIPGEVLTETGSLVELILQGHQFLVQTEKSHFAWTEITGIEETNRQEECRCLVLTGTTHLYIADGIVTHNCLDPEQDILMFNGSSKKVKDVHQGDLLMGPDGKPRRILTTSTGYGPLYRIIPIKGSGKPWICNDAHILTLQYTSRNGSRPARKMTKGVVELDHKERDKHYKGLAQVFGPTQSYTDRRRHQKMLEENKFTADVCIQDFINRKAPSHRLDSFWKLFRPAGIEFPDDVDNRAHGELNHRDWDTEEFYLTGAWIGNGFLRDFAWCNQAPAILESIRNYFEETQQRKRKLNWGIQDPKKPEFQIVSTSKAGFDQPLTPLERMLYQFTNASEKLKTIGQGSLRNLYLKCQGHYDKDIPHWALIAPREKRLALLAGMLDTDGSLQQEGRCFDFVQKRKHIVEKTVWLCRSLGLAAADPYEAWKECTNRTQSLPTIEDLTKHPILLQQLVERALLKIKLRLREGKTTQEEADRLQSLFGHIQTEIPSQPSGQHDGHLRYTTAKKLSAQYSARAAGLIETIKTLYFVWMGKSPRKEIVAKYIRSDEEFSALIAAVKEKCGFEKAHSDAETWFEESEWTKAHTRIEAEQILEGELPFNIEALHELLTFHESEPRERYWRTNISGNIEMIPTRVPHKQVKGLRPQKREKWLSLPQFEENHFDTKDPLCFGWDAEPIGDGPYCGFTLDGDGRFLLGDFTVTHNTVSLMVPMLRQFFRMLRDPDDKSEFAKCGALILDEKGDFIDSTITELLLAGRSLQDLIIVDPDLDLYRYNPLDPQQTADENATKLAKVQKILGTSSGGDNAYWDQTSQVTIKYFLQLLEVYKPKHKIGLDDIARFMRDDDLATVLCDTVEASIEAKKKDNEISEDDYGTYTDAISNTRNGWIQLNPNTKSTLKTTITNMLGPIASNPRLQKVFCRDTNFSFSDLPNKGKIVLFRGSGIDKATARLICVCLKIDFQTWQKRRNGSSAAAYGLNTMRTVLFMCDEYQEFVTCGGEGDETFYGVSRSTRTAPIVATQSYNSLETAIKNKEQTKTLRQNITTWVFFRSTDQDTCELGKFLAGQSKKEDFSTSQNTDGLLSAASNLGSHSGKENTINISKKLEENFRTDDFSRLVTMTMEKSKKGPWYSEAIVYHYHDIDESAESRCYKTRLPHLYYDNKLRKQAGLNVKHFDHILYDRNWQRKALQRGLILIQEAIVENDALRKDDLVRTKSQEEINKSKRLAEENPEKVKQRQKIQELVNATKQENQNTAAAQGAGGLPGAINNDDFETKEEIETQIAALEDEKINTVDEDRLQAIQILIDNNKTKLSRFVLQKASTPDNPERHPKRILRSSSSLPTGFKPDPIDDPEDPANDPTNPANGEGDTSGSLAHSIRTENPETSDPEADHENDELWSTDILPAKSASLPNPGILPAMISDPNYIGEPTEPEPQEPEAGPETPDIPDAPETPDASDLPENPDIPDAPETPDETQNNMGKLFGFEWEENPEPTGDNQTEDDKT